MADQFYHIKLYSKGKIEIFQNVFWHQVHVKEREIIEIEIRYSSHRSRGNCTYSTRPMDKVYNFEVRDGGNCEPLRNVPPIELITHGYFKEAEGSVNNG